MDKAKSMMDKKGASGPFHVNNGQSQRGCNGHVAVAANGGCCSGGGFGSSPGTSGGGGGGGGGGGCSSFDSMHHLHRGEEAECNGSPAKRSRLRRRTESVRRNRPRKCQTSPGVVMVVVWGVVQYELLSDVCSSSDMISLRGGCMHAIGGETV